MAVWMSLQRPSGTWLVVNMDHVQRIQASELAGCVWLVMTDENVEVFGMVGDFKGLVTHARFVAKE